MIVRKGEVEVGNSGSTDPAEAPPAQSFLDRLTNVFMSPSEAFLDIARRPDFLAPLIVIVLSALAIAEAIIWKIGMERIIRNTLEQSGRAEQMSPEQLEQAVERGAALAGTMAHIGGLLGPAFYVLLVAGLGLLILNLVFGETIKFKAALSVACYAHLPASLGGGLMAISLIFMGDPDEFNPQSPVPASIGFFLDPKTVSKPLYTFLISVDIFTIWFLLLLGVGLSEVCRRKVKPLSISLSYFVLWAFWIFGKMGLAAVIS